MIREERAKYLSQLIIPDLFDNSHASCELRMKQEEALYETIAELMQEPCEDCISRQAALRQAINAHKMAQENGFDFKDICEEYLNVLPPVTPQQKTGHWIFDEILDKHYYCSECKSMGVDYWDYCPNCGAKMKSEE